MYTLPETLTLAQANATVRAIEAVLGEGSVEHGALAIDASGLRSFDTSAIALIFRPSTVMSTRFGAALKS